jgi:predicted nucleic acid-binding protein
MAGDFVLDCSIAAAWFFADEFSAYTRSVRGLILEQDTTAVVPAIWSAEVANVLFQAERRKRISPENVNQAMQILSQLPIETDHLPITNMGHVLHLCRQYTLTSYDALYLELALRRNIALATQDRKLKVSAKAAGVKLVTRV